MELNKIYEGNCVDVLKTFPDNSINCCITSPPYYGLRDYGTAKWVGGDPNCPHKRLSKQSDKTITGHAQAELIGNVGDAIFKTVCPLCGAVREDLQVGLEESPEEYIQRLVEIFREVRRIMTDDGTLWINIGDTYNASSYNKSELTVNVNHKQATNKGSYENGVERPKAECCKPKDLIGIPWMLAFALRNDGWYLRQDIIWAKPNPMPESVKDRCTKSHEYIFMLTKSPKYYFDSEAIQEKALEESAVRYKYEFMNGKEQKDFRPNGASNTPGMKQFTGMRNKRDVWNVVPSHYKEAHFATFPEELVYPMLIAGCPRDGVVLDTFMGSGTVAVVAKKNHRKYIGIDLNAEYIKMAERRLRTTTPKLF